MKATDKQIMEALKKYDGNVSETAIALSIARSSLCARIDKSTALKQALEDARGEFLDLGESVLKQNVKAGKEASVFFLLKCWGRSRGWVEKQIVEQTNINLDETERQKAIEQMLGIKGEQDEQNPSNP